MTRVNLEVRIDRRIDVNNRIRSREGDRHWRMTTFIKHYDVSWVDLEVWVRGTIDREVRVFGTQCDRLEVVQGALICQNLNARI